MNSRLARSGGLKASSKSWNPESLVGCGYPLHHTPHTLQNVPMRSSEGCPRQAEMGASGVSQLLVDHGHHGVLKDGGRLPGAWDRLDGLWKRMDS